MPEALAAVSIISPLYSIVLFLTIVIADATSNKVQLELGEFNKEKAGCVLITGMQYAVIIGILILLFFLFGKNAYFRFMNVSETTVQYAKAYLLFFRFSYALIPFNVTLDYFISDSANIKLMYAKRVVSLIGNTLLAFILAKRKVLSEWDVWIEDDKVIAIVRDNGRPFDFTDEDNSTGSLGAYILSCLIPNIGRVNYATTVSMNRHRFQVSRTQQKIKAQKKVFK